jgi:hypothetical protein
LLDDLKREKAERMDAYLGAVFSPAPTATSEAS